MILTPPTPTGARGRFRDSQTRLCPLALRSGCTERGLGSSGRRGPLQILIKYQHLLLPWLLLRGSGTPPALREINVTAATAPGKPSMNKANTKPQGKAETTSTPKYLNELGVPHFLLNSPYSITTSSPQLS